MNCNCEVCQDSQYLRDCGVCEDFRDRWEAKCFDHEYYEAILDGSWPNAVSILEKALENAKLIRAEKINVE